MVFSTNQARHLYVANAMPDAETGLVNAGDIQVKTDVDGKLYFAYMGKDGVMRSDLIENITYAKATAAAKMATSLKTATIAVTTLPAAGQDVVLRLTVRQFAGISDEETYSISVSARVVAGSTTSTIADELRKLLTKTLAKNISKLFTVGGSGANIVIQEVAQEWTLGVKEQVPVYFDAVVVPAVVSGVETAWGTVTYGTNGTVNNGHKIADLEYFCMGERGDQYRNVGWPNAIKTDYMVDPASAYDVLDIHYAYQGTCEDIQKSEKDITIVSKTTSVLNAIIGAINSAVGTSIATL